MKLAEKAQRRSLQAGLLREINLAVT